MGMTQVSGTVVDPNGIPYALGRYTAVLLTPGGTPVFTVGGARVEGDSHGGLDENGFFTVLLADTTTITPGGCTWRIRIASNPGGIPQPAGFGQRTFITPAAGMAISGATQDLSATLSALAPPLARTSSSISPFAGDGSDGALVFDGTSTVLGLVPVAGVYTLTRDIYATNLSVSAGATILTNNFAIFANGTLTNNGTISNAGAFAAGTNGANATSSAGGAGGGGPLSPGANVAHYARITPATLAGTVGGAGANGAGAQATSTTSGTLSANAPTASGVAGSAGSAGGQGGTGTGGAGGASRTGAAGGGAPTTAAQLGTNPFSAYSGISTGTGVITAYTLNSSTNGAAPGGSGGGGDGANPGGGGGGGGATGQPGGKMGLFVNNLINGPTGIITAAGAPGGNGGSGFTQVVGDVGGGGGGAGGSGGNGGILWIVYGNVPVNAGVITAAGGAGGAGGAKGLPNGLGTDNAAAGAAGPAGKPGVVIMIQS